MDAFITITLKINEVAFSIRPGRNIMYLLACLSHYELRRPNNLY